MKRLLFLLPFLICNVAFSQNMRYFYNNMGDRIQRTLPLPVTLIGFNAWKQEQAALLKWETASEVNSDYFEVQRSTDGKRWGELGAVTASGDKTTESRYSFIDQSPFHGENLYRLKMVDRDGTFAYSSIKALDFGSLLIFFPNPVKDQLRVQGLRKGRIIMTNIEGKTIFQSNYSRDLTIDLRNHPSGIYTVNVVEESGNVVTTRIVKQ